MIFRLLFQLHAHGIIHGDPRITNVITLADSTLRWIDFRSATAGFYEDESLWEYATKNVQVTQLMRRCSNSPSEAKMMEVYDAAKLM
jgi:tRNA A-37 threonylcarbamoyl transferase component Bud32